MITVFDSASDISYRMLQLLALPLGSMDRSALQAALAEISRS